MSDFLNGLHPTTREVLITVVKVLVTFHVLLGLFSVVTYV